MLMMKIRDVVIGFIVSAVVVGIAVSCGGGGGGSSGPTGPATYTVSGTLSGATGTIVLKLNGGSDLSKANGPFTFTTMLASGATFNVQAVDASDRCTVTGGAGTMTAANVTGVAVACAAPAGEKVVRSAGFSQVVPSAGSGTGGVIFDPGTSGITGGVTVFGITPTVVKLFQTPVGAPSLVVQLTSAGDNHTFFIPANTSLNAGQGTSLSAGNLYFEVFTSAYPDTGGAGEIRGQINLQGGVLAGVSAMDFAQEVSPPMSCTGITSSGQGMVMVDQATRNILISYMTHDVPGVSASHIHTSVKTTAPPCAGGPACNGPVITNFTFAPTLTYPTVPPSQPQALQMSDTDVSHFLADYLYFNIHSQPKCPGGEVRGNITHIQ